MSSKLRILMLSDYFYPQIGGGVEKVVHETSKRLAKMGCEVLVITLGKCPSQDNYKVDGINVCRLPAYDLTESFGLQLCFPKNVFGAFEVAKKFNPDIIHAHNIFFTTSLLAVLFKRIYNKKMVITAHLGDVRKLALVGHLKALVTSFYEYSLGTFALASSDKVIAVSNSVRDYMISLGVTPKKVVVIQNGVDLEGFLPAKNNIDSKGNNVLFIGRLLPNKGLKYLIEAAEIIVPKSSRKIIFKIVGDGAYREYFEDLVASKGLTDYFVFLGKVPSISEIFQDGGIFVRPSLTEGMPLTVLEAMASQLPTIASNVAGTSELIIQNETGLLVESGNVKQLADSILRLVESPELAGKLGNNARKFIEQKYKERYSWDAVAESTLSVYNTLGEK
jgi:glycosyltransferase involved in cell wall biosynthesis